MQTDGHYDSAAGCEPERVEIHAGSCSGGRWPRRKLTADGGTAAADDRGYNAIRFGLAAIKNVGARRDGACHSRARGAVATSSRWKISAAGSIPASPIAKCWRALVKCGAFDFLDRERAELFACIDDALAASAVAHRDRMAGQVSLFGDTRTSMSRRHGSGFVTPWSDHEKMCYEKELLGFYVTGHPLDAYADVIANGKYQTIASLNELSDRATFRVAGAITQVDKKFTRKEGKPFAVVWLEDLTGTLELVVWNELYLECAEKLVPGNVVGVGVNSICEMNHCARRRKNCVSFHWKFRVIQIPNRVETPPLCLHFSPNAGSR